jgi:hypothetical protein
VKKASRAKKGKGSGKPNADRINKKAEVIAIIKRAKGATLAEIAAAHEPACSHDPGISQPSG